MVIFQYNLYIFWDPSLNPVISKPVCYNQQWYKRGCGVLVFKIIICIFKSYCVHFTRCPTHRKVIRKWNIDYQTPVLPYKVLAEGKVIHNIHFPSLFQRETTTVASCIPSYEPSSLGKGIKKENAPQGQILSFRSRPLWTRKANKDINMKYLQS